MRKNKQLQNTKTVNSVGFLDILNYKIFIYREFALIFQNSKA